MSAGKLLRVQLRDGTPAVIRPIQPEDKQRLQEGLQRLSTRSRYQRFHAGVSQLSEKQLRYLTEVDGRDHVAWVAENPEEPDEPGMGVARYIRLAQEPQVAEAAVTVADRYQGKGLGTLLLGVVARSAVENGIRVLRNHVLADNNAMLSVTEGFQATRTYEGQGVYRVDMPLPADPEELPGTAACEVLRAVARRPLPSLRRLLPDW